MFVTCFLLCWRFCFLFPPNSLSYFLVFPPLSQVSHDTSVSDTSVSPGQVSFHTHIRRCDIKISQVTYLYTSILQVSRLCRAKPTAWKRGCGKVKSPPIPHCQKESAAMLALFLRTLFENSTLKYTWQLTYGGSLIFAILHWEQRPTKKKLHSRSCLPFFTVCTLNHHFFELIFFSRFYYFFSRLYS